MTVAPPVLLGLPSYNGERHLAAAIESLLSQRDKNFRLTIVDDCSSDGTMTIAESYATADLRIAVERNASRLGLVRNWRRVFERAGELHGSSPYFAWVSDHDLWDPHWLAALRAVLDSRPEVVCAYPRALTFTAKGRPLPGPRRFGTVGAASPLWRMAVAHQLIPAGFAVYGLFRAEALRCCGVYEEVLLPDRLLLSQLAFLGDLHQVPEVLWYRRGCGRAGSDASQQRAAIFPSRAPLRSRFPWWLTHTMTLGRSWVIERRAAPRVSPRRALAATAVYLAMGIIFELRRTRARWMSKAPQFAGQRARTAGAPRLTSRRSGRSSGDDCGGAARL